MKKFVLVLAVLMLAGTAFGDAATITAAQVLDTNEVTITYSAPGKLPRAFALDITVDNSQTIGDVTNFFVGECNDSNGYGIFPASFNREIDADDPNWADVNYTPVAEPNDLAGDTQGGKGTSGVTIEMGSLYAAPKGPPGSSGTLCSIWVSGDCNVSIAANVGRAGVVFEDGNAPSPLNLIGCHVTLVVICTVPDVVDTLEATAITAIENAGFVAGTPTTEKHDTIVAGNVISTDPAALAEPGCDTTVEIVTSLGPCIVPDVVDMESTLAQAAIIAEGFTIGNITTACSVSIADGNVISTNPAALAEPGCGSAVDIVVSTGAPTVPNIVAMVSGTAASAAITGAGFTVGTVTCALSDSVDAGHVISQSPGPGPSCATTVDFVLSKGPIACVTGLGDLNNDSWISPADITALQQIIKNYGPGAPDYYWVANTDPNYSINGDLNQDDWLSPSDITALEQMVKPYGPGAPDYYWLPVCDVRLVYP